jgi:hypothetical protein
LVVRASAFTAVPSLFCRELPDIAPRVQQQQHLLNFLCEAHAIDDANPYFRPLKKFYKRISFLADELGGCKGDKVHDLVEGGCNYFPWIDADDSRPFFEFKVDPDPCLENVDAILSKTYDRGLVMIIYYFEFNYYVLIEDAEGEHALIETNFPDISQRMQGMVLADYSPSEVSDTVGNSSLLLWQATTAKHSEAQDSRYGSDWSTDGKRVKDVVAKPIEFEDAGEAATGVYTQMYCVQRPLSDGLFGLQSVRNVMMRAGLSCYEGQVELPQRIEMHDLPAIPELGTVYHSYIYMLFAVDVSAICFDSPTRAPSIAHPCILYPLVDYDIHSHTSPFSLTHISSLTHPHLLSHHPHLLSPHPHSQATPGLHDLQL